MALSTDDNNNNNKKFQRVKWNVSKSLLLTIKNKRERKKKSYKSDNWKSVQRRGELVSRFSGSWSTRQSVFGRVTTTCLLTLKSTNGRHNNSNFIQKSRTHNNSLCYLVTFQYEIEEQSIVWIGFSKANIPSVYVTSLVFSH